MASSSTELTIMNLTPKKEYSLNRPTPFTGDWSKIEAFVQECGIYLAINESIYDNEPSKVAFRLSFLTDKEALKWKEQDICSITKDSKITFLTYMAFMLKLQEAFHAVNLVDSAMQKLALLQQGNRLVESMIKDFRLLIGEADLSTTLALDQIHLIKMFMTCLNTQLKKKIIFRDIVLKTIEEWYAKATEYDSNFWLAQAMMALDNQKKNTGKSWFNQNQNQNKDPNAIDIGATTTTTTGTAFIGALTEEMRAALMKIGACFWCRKTGHLFHNCSLKHQGQQQQPQQQKTYTPKDVYMNIWSMTAEKRKELMEMLTADLGFLKRSLYQQQSLLQFLS